MFASKTAEVLTYHQKAIPHICLQEGWFEQDPMAILQAVKETIEVTCENLKKLNIEFEDIVAVGITNQRETTVLWDKITGKPLCNALGNLFFVFFLSQLLLKVFLRINSFVLYFGHRNLIFCLFKFSLISVWMDMRTSSTVDEILQYGKKNQNFLQYACGLPVSTYFSALKIKWMMDNEEGVKKAMEENRCLFGNIDTWIIWVRIIIILIMKLIF